MQLPPALQPWNEWLAWFSPDIAATVGDILVRLDPAIGATSASRLEAADEPDGVDDLRRRGNYERLLMTEWAIADAMPDEFLRRAVGGEHLFLSPRRRAKKVDRSLVALFDVGPAQLGAPRLAHVALWILLARRAARANARFAWGALQTPGLLYDDRSPKALSRLLDARTFAPVSIDHRRRWLASFGTPASTVGERWTIGGDGDGEADAVGATHSATVMSRLDGNLDVDIATRRARRRVRVQPLRNDAAVRLLRGDFTTASTGDDRRARVSSRFQLQQQPLFSWRNRCIAVALLDEPAVCILTLPSGRKRSSPPRKVQWPTGKTLVAAALNDQQFTGVLLDGRRVALYGADPLQSAPLPADDDFRVAPGRGRWLWCRSFRLGERLAKVVALDDAGTLYAWTGTGHDGAGAPVARGVLGVVRAGQDRLVYASTEASTLVLTYWNQLGNARVIGKADVPFTLQRCLLAGVRQRAAWRGAVAVELQAPHDRSAPKRWQMAAVDSSADTLVLDHIPTGSNWKVVGVVRTDDPTAVAGYGLLAVDASRRSLVVAARGCVRALYASTSEIGSASVSDDGSIIALIDGGRCLVVLSYDGSVLFRADGSGGTA